MPDVVIDLGDPTDGAAHSRPAVRRRPSSYRAVVALLPVLLVGDADGRPGSQVQNRTITVYDLPSAALASRTAVTVTGPVLQVRAVDGLLLVSHQADGPGNIVTAAYTAGTGHAVWRRYGRLFGVTGSGRVALLADDSAIDTRAQWVGVDLRSGQDVWRLDRREGNAEALSGADGQRLDTLIVVTPDGRIEAHDVDTGRVTAAARTPALVGDAAEVGLTGDLLLVGTPPTTVFDLADGAVRATLGRWLPVGVAGPDGTVPVIRKAPGRHRVFYGQPDPHSLTVRVAGVAEQVSGDCDSAAGVLVCRRLDSSTGVWPFAPP